MKNKIGYIVGLIGVIVYLYVIIFEIFPALMLGFCSGLAASLVLIVFTLFGYIYSFFNKDFGSFMILIGSIATAFRTYLSTKDIFFSAIFLIPFLICYFLIKPKKVS